MSRHVTKPGCEGRRRLFLGRQRVFFGEAQLSGGIFQVSVTDNMT